MSLKEGWFLCSQIKVDSKKREILNQRWFKFKIVLSLKMYEENECGILTVKDYI